MQNDDFPDYLFNVITKTALIHTIIRKSESVLTIQSRNYNLHCRKLLPGKQTITP